VSEGEFLTWATVIAVAIIYNVLSGERPAMLQRKRLRGL